MYEKDVAGPGSDARGDVWPFRRPRWAQETVNYASVSGRVTDPQGAVVPGALVTARQTETNVMAEVVTDEEGRFRFPYLKVGQYEIAVHLEGFADATRIAHAHHWLRIRSADCARGGRRRHDA